MVGPQKFTECMSVSDRLGLTVDDQVVSGFFQGFLLPVVLVIILVFSHEHVSRTTKKMGSDLFCGAL
jgi:hypothetical protein